MSLLTTSPSFMSSLSFLLFILLLAFHTQHANFVAKSPLNEHFSEYRMDSSSEFPISHKETFKIHSKARKLKSANVIIRGNETIQSVNRTFQLGFFSTNGESNWYLGIWYAIPTQTRVWVANRENPIKNISQSSLEITETGQLAVKESPDSIVWQSTNTEKAKRFALLESGNLVLYSTEGSKIWQSFDHPTDTWLPGMNITTQRSLTSWKSLFDPSPGHFSLRLNPQAFNEFQLVYNSTNVYWSTGKWTGTAFANVPEMTIRYIYKFHFSDPYLPTASFWYTERALDNGLELPLTRFQVDVNGQLKQFTWSSQTENWNMFWSEPEDKCKVYGLCGFFGSCVSTSLKPCVCLNGFRPVDDEGWKSEDFTSGCRRESDDFCKDKDGFEEVADVGFDGGTTVSFQGSRSSCEKSCLSNCSCIGLFHNGRSNLCKNVYGSLLNLRNLSSDGLNEDVFYIRVPKEGIVKENVSKTMVLVGSIVGSIAAFGFMGVILLVLKKRRENKKGKDDDGVFPGLNMKVFTYKELNSVTRGFSEKLGHGGFGAVFRGELSDSTPVAVKRLERPGSGEKEFRAEVCTIGNIQHVNLVRLRGFCSENSRRLLVYDYMPNGPLSAYLRRDGPNLCWDVRFRVAVGTARGIAYLHEECRDCIIHCDIKPENILLDGDYMAKVSDFGLAKLVGRDFSRVLATMRGTWGYVAPEWISGLAITPKADVYSYGMTLLELIGGRRNVEAPQSAGNANVYGEGGYGEKWFFPPWAARQIIEGNVAAIVDSRLGVAYNVEEAERLALVAIWCIQDDEETRPTMGMVVKMLEGVVEVAIPPPPKLIQALVAGESYRGVRMDSGMSTAGGCSDYNVGFSSAGSRSSLDAKECPVSKGEVTVKTLDPIYGRANITHEPEEDSGLKIPPRRTARADGQSEANYSKDCFKSPVGGDDSPSWKQI
ncbi:PREDICTED: G-type lectin S-receptor-like serine/threonine-protein kinase SD2-2 [Theobroma cacao]|uniref:non-specific serine/threonine protein kinase n=1 Tax=Theobroma cacao TaxID=3641 RepID=A0AB32VVY8_THECC|nr:PREDICTED: G-type lectin S-receptor-like serine/threonine-protein kinase SD2-2 [Theobroma cacao]